MAAKHSAGIVLLRALDDTTEILLVHPGGPFWANKDEHGWSIPKGEFDPETESGYDAACREFEEELGRPMPGVETADSALELPPFKAGRKTIHAWMVLGDFDADNITSNTTEIEWPPRSGQTRLIPEVDRAAWFTLAQAQTKLHKGQAGIVALILGALHP